MAINGAGHTASPIMLAYNLHTSALKRNKMFLKTPPNEEW